MIRMHRDQPVIMMANIGTTMTEAKDDLGLIKAIFRDFAISNHYIHCDAALAGVYSALLDLQPGFDLPMAVTAWRSVAINSSALRYPAAWYWLKRTIKNASAR
jgi:hypothetical protein